MRDELKTDTPRLIREVRAALGWNQTLLGGRFGVHQTVVSQWERGMPAPTEVERWARAFAAGWRLGYQAGKSGNDDPLDSQRHAGAGFEADRLRRAEE